MSDDAPYTNKEVALKDSLDEQRMDTNFQLLRNDFQRSQSWIEKGFDRLDADMQVIRRDMHWMQIIRAALSSIMIGLLLFLLNFVVSRH